MSLNCKNAVTLIILLACGSAYAENSIIDVTSNLNQSQPKWFPDSSDCPADAIPKIETEITYLGERCVEDAEECLRLCESEDPKGCYALALAVQAVDNGAVSDALFHRACALGVISGCTNRAAGMIDDDLACSVRTVEKTSARRDSWGCTMFGFFLSTGKGIEKDTDRALGILEGSCRYGEEDDACKYAQALIDRIGNEDQ